MTNGDLVRHWGWVLSQTDVQPSNTDRLVWFLTSIAAFLFLVCVVLFIVLRSVWRNR